ncbi:MAG TPA: hypothetical protein VM582_09225, partial [Candidatus Thermoplasmatota archaeon]|nr:hypothetical protein [Candidatus Thermoplasmatota archaeon]
EVVGSGSVALVDGRELRASDAAHVDADHPVSVERMIVHTLAAGATFRLDGRLPVPMAARRRRRGA